MINNIKNKKDEIETNCCLVFADAKKMEQILERLLHLHHLPMCNRHLLVHHHRLPVVNHD